MKKIILILLLIPLISFSQKENKKSIDSLTVGMKVSKGLINTYQNSKNQLFFEVNKDIFIMNANKYNYPYYFYFTLSSSCMLNFNDSDIFILKLNSVQR